MFLLSWQKIFIKFLMFGMVEKARSFTWELPPTGSFKFFWILSYSRHYIKYFFYGGKDFLHFPMFGIWFSSLKLQLKVAKALTWALLPIGLFKLFDMILSFIYFDRNYKYRLLHVDFFYKYHYWSLSWVLILSLNFWYQQSTPCTLGL